MPEQTPIVPKGHVAHAFAAFRFSLQGLRAAFHSETAFKQETLVLVLIPFMAWVAGFSKATALLLTGAWLVVMVAELLNLAVECLADLVSPGFHPLVKKAKDAGSAAVLMAICANILLWAYLLFA